MLDPGYKLTNQNMQYTVIQTILGTCSAASNKKLKPMESLYRIQSQTGRETFRLVRLTLGAEKMQLQKKVVKQEVLRLVVHP